MRKDIDLSFAKHPLTGDLATKKDDNALKQSLRNVVLTSYYERGFNVEFGTPLRSSLFENVGPLEANTIKDNIERAIENFEPQAELIDVYIELESSSNTLNATIIYTKANNPEQQTVTVDLNRIR